MYQFVFGFINIRDLSIDVEWQVCTTLLVSQLSPFASDLIFIYTLIIGLLLTSKSQNMIIILEFPNGKNVNWEAKKTVIHCKCTSPRMLVHAKPCPKSTCYRFKLHLRIIPGRGKCIVLSPVVMITWPAKFNFCTKLSSHFLLINLS